MKRAFLKESQLKRGKNDVLLMIMDNVIFAIMALDGAYHVEECRA